MEKLSHQQYSEIDSVLGQLKNMIRKYVLIEGIAILVAIIGMLFWVGFGIDVIYFWMSRLDLPIWFRKLFAVSAVCFLVYGLLKWVLFRFLRSMTNRSLALVLEKQFPELNDRLITAVESRTNDFPNENQLHLSMLDKTIDDVAGLMKNLDLGQVFNLAPLKKIVTISLLLIVSVFAFAWANQPAFARLQRAYLNWDESYWERKTVLEVSIVSQPGDVIKGFKNFQYKHPRGADLTILVKVPENAVVPDVVRLKYSLEQGGKGTVYLTKSGDREFRHSIGSLVDNLQFSIRGGDFATSKYYHVLSVESPRIDSVNLKCLYPEYTGLNSFDSEGKIQRENIVINGSSVSLPMETDFILVARANKPLRKIRISGEDYELQYDADSGELKYHWQEDEKSESITIPLSDENRQNLIQPDFLSLQIPFRISSFLEDKESSGGKPDGSKLAGNSSISELIQRDGFRNRMILKPDSQIRIELWDQDDVASLEPARLTVNGIIDEDPVVETELKGIGFSITRKAVIPITGVIRDDYGIENAYFEYKIDKQPEWSKSVLSFPPEGRLQKFDLKTTSGKSDERFSMLPLELKEGSKFTLSVVAVDGDQLNGPHSSRGESYTFSVVSEQELLSILYGKEINLRKRFEQIISEIEKTKSDLESHRDRVVSLNSRKDSTNNRSDVSKLEKELKTAVDVLAERSLHQVRKNSTESVEIAEAFRGILDELINNSLQTSKKVKRLEESILDPLTNINAKLFPASDKELGLLKLAIQKERNPIESMESGIASLDRILRQMRLVLKEMQELVKYHQAVNQLKLILENQKKLLEKTEQIRKKNLLKKLKGFDLE